MANWLTGNVVEKIQWNSRLYSLRIEADLADFKAGQFIRVALDIDGERVARPYSLVNRPGEGSLEIFFNIVPEGPLSPRLAALEAGDEIFVAERANGFLTIDEVPESRHLWMLATGTGVGPFLSILKAGECWQRFDKVVLAYSVRDSSELAYRRQIAEIEEARPQQFRFIPCITRESVEDCLNERIPAAIESGNLEKNAGIRISRDDSHIMMCGNSAMITSVSELLQQRGLKKHLRREPGQVTVEKYH
ncbi:MAG TPA: ferredoxin--NADP reductase [Gammaproteobacteria bacterium]|nr:ferredoxin--NADP reductase [Gammaproteobacteria bacterium]